MNADPKVIVALDYNKTELALEFAEKVTPALCRLKVGKELFAIGGPELVKKLIAKGFDVFLDLKYHDIPHTVAKACEAAANMGVWMVNVHALGGRKMMMAAKQSIEQCEHQPLLIAVTILTSMAPEDLEEVGLPSSAEENVLRLAQLAQSAGLDGVVCSALEAQTLRATLGEQFCLVTPGIRPQGSAKNDQTRIMTPEEAVSAGASYLVVGRPITQADDPVAVIEMINASIT